MNNGITLSSSLGENITIASTTSGFITIGCSPYCRYELAGKPCYNWHVINCSICEEKYCETHIKKCEHRMCNIYICLKEDCSKKHLDECLPETIIRQQEEIDELRESMKEMNKILTDILYAPNGIMYQEAKKDFESKMI